MTKIDLVLLGLLMEQPRHGYDIKQEIERRDMKNWVGISTPSIYNGLSRLERQGALTARKESREHHADRTVYTVTEAGRNSFRRGLQEMLGEMEHPYFQILLGLGFSHLSEKGQLLENLETRQRGLEAWVDILDRERKRNQERKLYPMTSDFIIDYYIRFLAMEVEWLTEIRERIAAVENWPEGAFDYE